MATSIREFEQGGYYHLYNRGNHRQPIYFDARDYQYFLDKLEVNCQKYDVSILAYCLMKNHYHILLRQNREVGITAAMLGMSVSYVKRFNGRYQTVGRLFQERFRAVRVMHNEQLLQVSRYIHLNPAQFTDPATYLWSSYRAYTSGTLSICDTRPVLDALSTYSSDYGAFVATPGVEQYTTPGVAR